MSEKGTREFLCNACRVRIRIRITSEQYGKTIEGECPRCVAEFRVTIPTPAQTSSSFADVFGDLGDLFDKK